jgi:putative MATE family efflux protein
MVNLLQGNVASSIFRFAVPMLIGNIFQQLYNVVDSIIVGKFIGKEALAAVGASFPIIFTLISLIIGISMGFTIIISQFYGAKEYEKIKRAVDTMNVFLIVSSIFVSIAGYFSCEAIFRLMQLPENIIPDAVAYLKIYFIGMISFFGFNGVTAILRGVGDSKTPLYFLIISTLLNIFLVLLMVLHFNAGVEGVAWATIISHSTAFIIAIFYVNKYHSLIKISFSKLMFDKDIFITTLKIGLPSGIQHTFVSLGMIALFGIVNSFGTDVIAAFTVAGRIDSFAMIPAMSFSAALTTFVGQNIGANQLERVRAGLISGIWMSGIVSISSSILFFFFSFEIMSWFTNDYRVIEIGVEYLVIVSSFYLFFSTMFMINGVLRGAGDTLIPMFITLFSLWIIRIPIAWILSKHIGEKGVWWAVPIAWFIGMLFSYFYYIYGNWKKKNIIHKHISEK